MSEKEIYITINHLEDYNAEYTLRPGNTVILRKDPENPYDDEAIAVYNARNCKTGYVANSAATVCRGTYSAGRLYDKIGSEAECIICFGREDFLIGLVKTADGKSE